MTRAFDRASLLPSDKITPHIVPDVLYPAIGGKLFDGTTSHSGNYGTSQTDSRKYYYTDIKGSSPIRDPRIGAHFGSQRHKFKSIQLLEQETATHGSNVYSVDGREWIRAVEGTNSWVVDNTSNGNYIGILNSTLDGTDFLEVTGFFNFATLSGFTHDSALADDVQVFINGGSEQSTVSFVAVNSPLRERYVDAGSVIELDLGTITSPKIVTLKLKINDSGGSGHYFRGYGIELIAQDTTSSTTRNQIQIPSQTVVSFGSKFSLSASTPHYDPFSAKSDGTAWTSPTSGTNNANSSAEWPSVIDTATSLGLANWVDGTNYYRPYNGGRVVKWVDENGEIKTSVTVMPPNAKSIGNSGTLTNGAAKTNGSDPNDNFRPTFETHTSNINEDLLSEVAKTYYWREFGNGAANGGSESGTYADASMVNTNADDVAYVMDDGLTSLSANDITVTDNSGFNQLNPVTNGDYSVITFIGTGITCTTEVWGAGKHTFAQNLPYGTHIVKIYRDADSHPVITVDGVDVEGSSNIGTYGVWEEVSFHQPKMPPIPEDCVILADYMLMADFIPQTSAAENSLSKGVRRQDVSRDIFYDEDDDNSLDFVQDITYAGGFRVRLDSTADDADSMKLRLPSFGTNFVHRGYASSTRTNLYTGFSAAGSSDTEETSTTTSGTAEGSFQYITTSKTLGLYNFGVNAVSGQNGHTSALEIVTPIHTSHHYKSFETPFLHELIGGDRNMEQTHLICSADGRTWDEVTRDTSYIGNCVLSTTTDTASTSGTATQIFDEWRGKIYKEPRNNFNKKHFAISYDRMICLIDGTYHISGKTIRNTQNYHLAIKVNGTDLFHCHATDRSHDNPNVNLTLNLQRGDYVQCTGGWYGDNNYNYFQIYKV